MAELKFYKKTVLWAPDDYTANSVEAVVNVAAGDLVGLITCKTIELFNGSGTAAKFELGDGDDPDRYLDDGELEETSTSAATSFVRAIGASGGGYVLYRNHLYTAADTIDVNFTANTSGTRTTGKVEVNIWIAKVNPF